MAAQRQPSIQNSTLEYKSLIDNALLGILKFNRYFTNESVMNSFSLVEGAKKQNNLSYFQANKLSFKNPPNSPADPDAKKLYNAEDKSKKTIMNISLFLRLLYIVITIDVKKASFIAKFTMNFRNIFAKNESLFRHFGDMFKIFTNNGDISDLKFILNATNLNPTSPVVIGKFSQSEHDHFKTVLKNINILADLLIQDLTRNAKLYEQAPITQDLFVTLFRRVANDTASERIFGVTTLRIEDGQTTYVIVFNWDDWRSTLRYQGDSSFPVKQESDDSFFPPQKGEFDNDSFITVKQEPVDDFQVQQPSTSSDPFPIPQSSYPPNRRTNTGLSDFSRNDDHQAILSSREKDAVIERLERKVRELQATSSEVVATQDENDALKREIKNLKGYIRCLKQNSDCISGGYFVFTDIILDKLKYFETWESNFRYYFSILVYLIGMRYKEASFKTPEEFLVVVQPLLNFARRNISPDPVVATQSFLSFFSRFTSVLSEIYSKNDLFKNDQKTEILFSVFFAPPYSFYLSPRFVDKLNQAEKKKDVFIARQYCMIQLFYTITRFVYARDLKDKTPFRFLYETHFQKRAVETFDDIIKRYDSDRSFQAFLKLIRVVKPETFIEIFQNQVNKPVCKDPSLPQRSSSPQSSSSLESLSDDSFQ